MYNKIDYEYNIIDWYLGNLRSPKSIRLISFLKLGIFNF